VPEKSHTILLIQGDREDARIVREALANSQFQIEWLRTGAAGLERLAHPPSTHRFGPRALSAVLVDLMLPDVAGLKIVDSLFAAAPQIPIIVIGSLKDEALAKAAIQRGAQDFLLKEHLNGYVLPKMLTAVLERAAITEALFAEKERAQVTLNSIGDAVISTDLEGRVTYLNLVAERLTGCPMSEAMGQPLEEVFRIIDAETRATSPTPWRKPRRKTCPWGCRPPAY
jgi:DNA-binding response OmpR family regulator